MRLNSLLAVALLALLPAVHGQSGEHCDHLLKSYEGAMTEQLESVPELPVFGDSGALFKATPKDIQGGWWAQLKQSLFYRRMLNKEFNLFIDPLKYNVDPMFFSIRQALVKSEELFTRHLDLAVLYAELLNQSFRKNVEYGSVMMLLRTEDGRVVRHLTKIFSSGSSKEIDGLTVMSAITEANNELKAAGIKGTLTLDELWLIHTHPSFGPLSPGDASAIWTLHRFVEKRITIRMLAVEQVRPEYTFMMTRPKDPATQEYRFTVPE